MKTATDVPVKTREELARCWSTLTGHGTRTSRIRTASRSRGITGGQKIRSFSFFEKKNLLIFWSPVRNLLLISAQVSSRLRVSGIQIQASAARRNAAPVAVKATAKPLVSASRPIVNGAAALAIRPKL